MLCYLSLPVSSSTTRCSISAIKVVYVTPDLWTSLWIIPLVTKRVHPDEQVGSAANADDRYVCIR